MNDEELKIYTKELIKDVLEKTVHYALVNYSKDYFEFQERMIKLLKKYEEK